MRLRIRMLWAALAAVSLLGACAPASQAASERPAHFWRTATQAISIADRQPSVERLHAAEPGARAVARPAALGLWQVVYREGARTRASVLVEDRTGDVLEPSPWAWPDPSSRMT